MAALFGGEYLDDGCGFAMATHRQQNALPAPFHRANPPSWGHPAGAGPAGLLPLSPINQGHGRDGGPMFRLSRARALRPMAPKCGDLPSNRSCAETAGLGHPMWPISPRYRLRDHPHGPQHRPGYHANAAAPDRHRPKNALSDVPPIGPPTPRSGVTIAEI